jgi:hypothetical protein
VTLCAAPLPRLHPRPALTRGGRHDQFRLRVNMYTIKEEREITPVTFAHLVSSTLYERRFGPYFIEPVVAGLEPRPAGGFVPFIASTDLIGCINWAKDFVVAGTASEKLFGMAEGLWEPDLYVGVRGRRCGDADGGCAGGQRTCSRRSRRRSSTRSTGTRTRAGAPSSLSCASAS